MSNYILSVWPFLNTHKTKIFVDCCAIFQSIFQMRYSPQPSKSYTRPSPSRAPLPGLWFNTCGLYPTFAAQGPSGIVCNIWISKGLQLKFGKQALSVMYSSWRSGYCEQRCVQTPGHYWREVSWAQIKGSLICILGSKFI